MTYPVLLGRRRPGPASTPGLATALAAIVLLLCGGCATASPGGATGSPEAAPRHVLWRVDGQAGHTAYLLGSVHVMPREGTYPLPGPMRAAFSEAEVVAFEINLDDAERAAMRLRQRGMGEPGEQAGDVLPDSTSRLLHTTLDSLGLPAAPFLRMKPWLIRLALPGRVAPDDGYSAAAGIDRHFYEKAKAAGKKRVALETIDDQIAVFDALPMKTQGLLLHATLRDLDDSRAQRDALVAAWRAGDTATLAETIDRSLQHHPRLHRRLLADRNRTWIPQIEALLERSDTSLVVVGAGHLVGPESVVAMLRDRGYDVVRL